MSDTMQSARWVKFVVRQTDPEPDPTTGVERRLVGLFQDGSNEPLATIVAIGPMDDARASRINRAYLALASECFGFGMDPVDHPTRVGPVEAGGVDGAGNFTPRETP